MTRPVARPEAVELSDLRRERTCERVGVTSSRPPFAFEGFCPGLLGKRLNTARVPLHAEDQSSAPHAN